MEPQNGTPKFRKPPYGGLNNQNRVMVYMIVQWIWGM